MDNKLAALDQFASGTREARSVALKELIRAKSLASSKDDPRFEKGLDSLASEIRDENSDASRLLAAADLGRIWSVVKGIREAIAEEIANGLGRPFPEISELSNADDRFYVGLVLRLAKDDWLVPYMARAAVIEEGGERARKEFIAGLTERADCVASLLITIGAQLQRYSPQTERPGDSRAKKLVRIVKVLRAQVLESQIPAGSAIATALTEFFESALAGGQRPETTSVAEEAIEECAALIHDIVRTRLVLVTEADVYASLKIPRRWLTNQEWRVFASLSPALAWLVEDLSDAMVLLGRQEIADDSLARELSALLGSRDDATKLMQQIAENHTELSPLIRDWLRNGGRVVERQQLKYAEESRDLGSDEHIALLLLDALRLANLTERVKSDVVPELEILEPQHATIINDFAKGHAHLIGRIESLAVARHLKVIGTKGEIGDYDAKRHEVVGGARPGIRKVRIIRPSVDRHYPGTTTETVIKALVERAD